MLVAELTDGDTDGAVRFGKLGEAPVDGVGEDGPEVFLGGGVERIGGDEKHFVLVAYTNLLKRPFYPNEQGPADPFGQVVALVVVPSNVAG